MHEAHISAALIAAAEGEHVLVVAATADEKQIIFKRLVEAFDGLQPGLLQSINRTNGGERIDLVTGGGIRFAHLNERRRRAAVYDQVFVPIGTAPEFLADLAPALATSEVGLITGY
ncbi:hypothetical protein [Arthrobacter sp. lap29]|uniref:hypothetical protein n=1 Tax=Arthrobacter sp. lap29 TaxID=3056122 RepID=UPI0028F74B96|nr:hypothetical protein [Arthrobacter sp. lap29]